MSVDYVPVPSLDEVDQRRSGSELVRTENLHQPRDDAAMRSIHCGLELFGMKSMPRAQETGVVLQFFLFGGAASMRHGVLPLIASAAAFSLGKTPSDFSLASRAS